MAKESNESRLEDIQDLAEYVAAEHHDQTGRVCPHTVLESQGVRLCFGEFGSSFEGLLEYRAGRFYAYCNLGILKNVQRPRARFTMAHEAGHYFLDEHRNALASGHAPGHADWGEFHSKNPVEREADIFASYLLMPRHLFAKAARRQEAGFAAVKSLAKRFGTSYTSTALRYIDDVFERAVLLMWTQEGVVWSRFSRNWEFEQRRPYTVSRIEQLTRGSATHRLLNNPASEPGTVLVQGTTTSAWFPRVKPGWQSNEILIEEAISLGRYGWMTLLRPDPRQL